MARKNFDTGPTSPFVFEVDSDRFALPDCSKVAEIGNPHADISDLVLLTEDSRYVRLTVVSHDGATDAYGVRKGWYTAYFIDADTAAKYRKSWQVLREQPPPPSRS